MSEFDLVLKLVDAGASIILAVVAILIMRSERNSRELNRSEDNARQEQQLLYLARIDERTATMLGDLTPVERPPPQRRTPAGGSPTEYSHARGRRG